MFVQQPDTATEPEYKYITTEDLAAYEHWCAPHVAAFNPIPSGPLYHYTTGNSLIEIIKSGELWATQVACLKRLIPLSQVALYVVWWLRAPPHATAASGALDGQGAISDRIPGDFSGRDELRGVSVRTALARGLCLPRLRRQAGCVAEEPGAHLRMSRLRSPNVDHSRHGDAPLEVAFNGMVLGRAPHGNPFQRHVGAPVGGTARYHVQDRLVADAETPAVDGRPRARTARGRRGSRSSGNPFSDG